MPELDAPTPPTPAAKPAIPAEGDLAVTSPLRLCALCADGALTGRLTLITSEPPRRLSLSFRRGTLEHAESDDPNLSLLRFLLGRAILTGQQAIAAEEHAARHAIDVVASLFQLQLIPPSQAHQVLADHMRYLLERALSSWKGAFTYEPDRPPPSQGFPLGQKWQLLAQAVRHLDPVALRARLGRKLQAPVARSGGLGIGRIEELSLSAQEQRLASAFDGVRTGEQLMATEAEQVIRTLYLLTELGHASFLQSDTRAAETAPKPPAPAAAQPQIVRERPAEPPPRGPPPVIAPVAGAAPRPAPATAPPPPSAPPAARPPVAPAPAAPAPAPLVVPAVYRPPAGESPEAAARRISQLADKMDKATHFEVLSLERGKPLVGAEIKKLFFLLARELHPDTVTDPAQEPLRHAKERLFARVNEAAQVLGDDKRRKEYEAELDGKSQAVDVSRIFAAEEKFQKAEILVKARKYVEALDLLHEAIKLNKDEAEFYALRGWANFLMAKDRKAAHEEAAADCKKALSMQPKCTAALFFLGQMAKILGDLKAAKANFEKVLELEPKHAEAQRELRYLPGGKK